MSDVPLGCPLCQSALEETYSLNEKNEEVASGYQHVNYMRTDCALRWFIFRPKDISAWNKRVDTAGPISSGDGTRIDPSALEAARRIVNDLGEISPEMFQGGEEDSLTVATALLAASSEGEKG